MRRTVPFLLVVFGSGALVSLVGFFNLRSSAGEVHASAPEPQTVPHHDWNHDYGRFQELFGSVVQGEDEPVPELREAARVLAERYGRDDAPRAVEYYAGLTPDERLEGLQDYYRFLEIRQEVDEAEPDSWAEARPEILERLEAFIAETIGKADFAQAGRGLSLSARIVAQQLRSQGPSARLLRQSDLEAAIREAREALAIFARAGLVTPQLEPLRTLGQLEDLREREIDAWDCFDECRRLAIKTRQPDFRQHAIVGLVQLARKEGDIIEARRLLEELASFRLVENCWPLAQEHAVQLIHADEADRAAQFLLRVRPIEHPERPLDPDELNAWRSMMAVTRLRQGDTLAARGLLEEIDPAEWTEEERLADAKIDLLEGRYDEVIARFGSDGANEDAGLSVHGRKYVRVLVGEALHQLGDDHSALVVLENARRIGESWEGRLAGQYALEAGTATVMGEWLGLHLTALEARVLARVGSELEAALAIERAQAEHYRRRGERSFDLEGLLAWAAHFEHGLVTWVAGADHGLAVHITSDGRTSSLEIDRTRVELRRAVRRFREALLLDDVEAVHSLSTELCEALLPDGLWEELLRASGSGRLLCVAHGPIERLALEALCVEGVALDELVTLLVLPTLDDPAPGEAPREIAAWRLLGDPVDATGDVRLPAARAELDELASILDGSTLATREGFDREVCLEALEAGAPLHLVTHLHSDAEGCEGIRFGSYGLELSRGEILCAQEIEGVVGAAPVVVLAACETSGGNTVEARGQQGLARAFLAGGTRNLLVTLWPVEDHSARRFTPLFHRALLEGQTPSRAARTARRELVQNGARIADWAAFRVIGRD